MSNAKFYCADCGSTQEDLHTEVSCLRLQLKKAQEDRDAWKEAWHHQREATGNVAWQYLERYPELEKK